MTDSPNHKGLTGLINLGNTCFLNSCMQILAHTSEFTRMKTKYKAHEKPEKPEYEILMEFEELRELMTMNEGIIRPDKFVISVHRIAMKKNRPIFTGWAQNDMPEFLLFIMECLHESICRPVEVHLHLENTGNTYVNHLQKKCYGELKSIYEKEYSEIMECFYGLYYSEIVSLDAHSPRVLSVKPEQYFILDLPIPTNLQHITIYDCLNLYCNPDVLMGENAWNNEITGEKEDVKKQIRFWNFPPVLVITFKRFSANGMHKLQNHIDFPIADFDLHRYAEDKSVSPNENKYDLFGVCNHMGGVQGGHYTAFVKHLDIMGGIWLHHNDQNIDIVKEEHIVSPTAYCLFYRRH